jgi:hypothetical protein
MNLFDDQTAGGARYLLWGEPGCGAGFFRRASKVCQGLLPAVGELAGGRALDGRWSNAHSQNGSGDSADGTAGLQGG